MPIFLYLKKRNLNYCTTFFYKTELNTFTIHISRFAKFKASSKPGVKHRMW